ncbi:hypothetical protein F8388_026544 [Cannabis sativa]|uniref:RNase H type-1 domain-containing protein n=1 Tax=Cannabis sativa TaxID=3483 RepID=A0A7J6EAM1_CANSA|nr:hypothetical protein F8388_026544 [Cannabis sativa]
MGFGMIVCNHKVEVVAALAIPWRGIHQPLIMEAHALQLALDWCQKNLLGELRDKIISLLSSLPQASIGYIRREANSAAHQLAKQALGLYQ